MLAELEAMSGGYDSALMQIDLGLAMADETEEHFTDPYLHRLRGECLLKWEPGNSAPAEEAFQTAIAVAKQQGARSYELLPALSLAKLYQSTSRPAKAHAVLAPGLEGFSPTPEMPGDRGGAGAASGLTQADEVKAQAFRRKRLTQLQLAYGNAFFAARGSGVVGFPQPRRSRLRSAMTALRQLRPSVARKWRPFPDGVVNRSNRPDRARRPRD